MNWDDFLSSKSVHQNWLTFKRILNNLLEEFVPFKMLESGSINKPPWLGDWDLNKACKSQHRAHTAFLKSGLYVDKLQMDYATRNYHTTLTEAKGSYEHDESRLAKDIASNNRRFYNYVKNYINPSSNIQCPIIDDRKVRSN